MQRVILVFLLALGALALVKPLSHEDRMLYANHVFTGVVDHIEHKDIPSAQLPDEWVNRHYKMVVKVKSVAKTTVYSKNHPENDHEEITEGSVVNVMMWKAWKRPEGVTGQMGVDGLPALGEEWAFYAQYLHRDPKRRSMYHDSFPHVESDGVDSGDADVEVNYREGKGFRKSYNVLTPNGIGPASELEKKHEL